MPGQHQELPPDVRLLEERERDANSARNAQELTERLEQEREREMGDEGGVRVVDKRGAARERTQQSVPVPLPEPASDDEKAAFEQQMAEQAAAADGEGKAEPALRCAAFVIISIDHNGTMHLHHDMAEIVNIINNGIQPERPANSADLMNMANQLQVMVQGNEISARVLEALNTHAQAAMARAAGMRPAAPPVATGRQV